jgi:tetratricopeptide (TPR) repeat protein
VHTFCFIVFIGFFGSALSATAAPALPDYRVVLGANLAESVAGLNEAGRYREAIKRAGKMQRAVGRLAAVSYEAGYAHYRLGEYEVALRHYDAALAQDPQMSSAAYDRGEIRLITGERDMALVDFQMVVHLRPKHWAGHFRLAHIAGLTGDPIRFEEHLMDALHFGFELEVVMTDPAWGSFVPDDQLRPVLRKVVALYGNAQLSTWVGARP